MTTPATQVDDDLTAFVDASAALTGIDAELLRPQPVDAHGTAQTYLDTVRANDPAGLKVLLQLYRDNSAKLKPNEIAKLIMAHDSAVKLLGRSIIALWYLASWYQPAALVEPQMFAPFVTISVDAYTQSWIWRIAQSHPMGYSEWEFGYWTKGPRPLTDFIGEGKGL
jgi:hypothetical protein